MMKKIFVPALVFAVVLLGYGVYHDTQMKKRQDMDQLIQEARQSLKTVENNPNNIALESLETAKKPSTGPLYVKSNPF